MQHATDYPANQDMLLIGGTVEQAKAHMEKTYPWVDPCHLWTWKADVLTPVQWNTNRAVYRPKVDDDTIQQAS